MQSIDETIALIAKMSIADRLRLAEAIWDSLDDSDVTTLSPEQRRELHRRVADHDSNPQSALTREEVEKRLAEFRDV